MQFKQTTPHVVALILIGSLASGQHLASGTVPHRFKSSTAIAPRLAAVTVRPPQNRDQWRKFNSEFSPRDSSPPAILKPIVTAKYGADVACFTLDNLANRLEDALELRFSKGHISRASTSASEPTVHRQHSPVTLEDARLKFDFEIASGKPYIGARLVLPFGN